MAPYEFPHREPIVCDEEEMEDDENELCLIDQAVQNEKKTEEEAQAEKNRIHNPDGDSSSGRLQLWELTQE